MKRLFTTLAVLFLTLIGAQAQDANAQKAREIFNKTYEMVFGSQGCQLHYDVNIIGLYKTNGIIWYKGKKQRFYESRYHSWSDGTTYYLVDTKKKTVDIYSNNDDNKDKYSSKFKFNINDYSYSYEDTPEGYLISLKPKPGIKGFKEARALIDKQTKAPKSVRIKVAFIWAKIAISQFKSGGISDNIFVFPKSQYKDYPTTDHR
ncbi:MAG: hypothetical protein IJ196_04155 [Prevotella sp.]|nr:hypothetical protein [Prevotella sp.]